MSLNVVCGIENDEVRSSLIGNRASVDWKARGAFKQMGTASLSYENQGHGATGIDDGLPGQRAYLSKPETN